MRGFGDYTIDGTSSAGKARDYKDATDLVLRMREGKDGGGKGPLISVGQSLTLATANDQVVYRKARRAQSDKDYETWLPDEQSNTLNLFDASASRATHLVGGVRRLTPIEWERLQGFPDGWTCLCGVNPCKCTDSARYRALGNAVTVNVAEWIGRRIWQASTTLRLI